MLFYWELKVQQKGSVNLYFFVPFQWYLRDTLYMMKCCQQGLMAGQFSQVWIIVLTADSHDSQISHWTVLQIKADNQFCHFLLHLFFFSFFQLHSCSIIGLKLSIIIVNCTVLRLHNAHQNIDPPKWTFYVPSSDSCVWIETDICCINPFSTDLWEAEQIRNNTVEGQLPQHYAWSWFKSVLNN